MIYPLDQLASNMETFFFIFISSLLTLDELSSVLEIDVLSPVVASEVKENTLSSSCELYPVDSQY